MRVFARGIVLAAASLIAGEAVPAQRPMVDCRGDRAVCQTLVRGEQALASMLVSGDVAVVARLFADDAVWSLASGARWTKRDAIAALRDAPKMAESRLLEASVRQHGMVAIVLWKESWRAPGATREEQAQGTDTWLLRNGRWQIIASQEIRLPPAR
jgi:ketosteroid isomerase-like protein